MTGEFHTVRGYQLLRQEKSALTPAMEDYLEMIFRNSGDEGYSRIIEIAGLLNVKASSATKMVQKLGELGLLQYKKYGMIVLTDRGREIGEYLLERHQIIERFMRTIGITDNLLVETELIEHNISPGTLLHMDILCRFFDAYPGLGERLKEFISANLK
jgi:Mn-dependent DtxR family transcriptional regulator